MAQETTMLGDAIIAARNDGYSLSWLEQLSERQDHSDIDVESLPELSENLTGLVRVDPPARFAPSGRLCLPHQTRSVGLQPAQAF
jgi:hypothetical protein